MLGEAEKVAISPREKLDGSGHWYEITVAVTATTNVTRAKTSQKNV
jgi:hypothetical protein